MATDHGPGTPQDETVVLRTIGADGEETLAEHVGTTSVHDLADHDDQAEHHDDAEPEAKPKATRRTSTKG